MSQTAFQKLRVLIRGGRLRTVGTEILAMSAMLLAASILLLWVSYNHLQQSFETGRRTSATLLLLDRVESKLVGVEMTLRGYALTNDPSFKRWGDREWRDLETAMAELALAMNAEPEQAGRFEKMRALVQQRLDLYAYLFLPGHTDEVATAIRDPKTRDVMHHARQTLAGLRQAQVGLLEVRQRQTDLKVRQTLYLTTGIVILAFVSVVFGIILSQGRRAPGAGPTSAP